MTTPALARWYLYIDASGSTRPALVVGLDPLRVQLFGTANANHIVDVTSGELAPLDAAHIGGAPVERAAGPLDGPALDVASSTTKPSRRR